MTWLTDVETELGVIKVDINHVIGKVISGVQIAAHEFDALFNWSLSQSANIAAGLNAAAPIISAVAGLATTAATGNPAAGAVVTRAISGVNTAFNVAQQAVKAMNVASQTLAASAASGNGAVVNDTAALMAGVQSVTGANTAVANMTTVALAAAKTLQALSAAPAVAPAS